MKFRLLAALILIPALASAAEPAASVSVPAPPVPSVRAPRAWLGLRVTKPDEMVAAQVPSVPPGIGFLVKSISKGGPAETAGVQERDLIWKIGDQMLVNEAQLAALLRLSKPGEEIVLAAFRGGKPLEIKLTLGEAPALQPPTGEMVESLVLPGVCEGPIRIAEKTASCSVAEGKASLRREGDIFKVSIQGPDDHVIYEGELGKDEDLQKIPADWQRKVKVLRRSLEHALDGNMMPQREPRQRVIPPVPKPAAGS